MGKFLNKDYINTINHIVDSKAERVNNNFYTFTDKAPTVVTYYNINTSKSSLDESSELAYSYTDDQSPLRYNLIEDLVIFGLDRISVELESGDFGVESNAIEGDCFIAPNTFIPYPQDYFFINHIDHNFLFKVTAVTTDTVPNGSNMYKVSYRLSMTTTEQKRKIDSLVVENFITVANNIGTNLGVCIRKSDVELISRLEDLCDSLRIAYNSLFYSTKVQTYIFTYDNRNFYDPYMIEFFIRNKLHISDKINYVHITQQIFLPSTFIIDYENSFFRTLEKIDKLSEIMPNPPRYATMITDPTSMLSQCIEDYYYIHSYRPGAYYPLETFDPDIVMMSKNDEWFESNSMDFYKNLVLLHLNHMDIDDTIINVYENLNLNLPAHDLFYYIPAAIYIFSKKLSSLMEKENTTLTSN